MTLHQLDQVLDGALDPLIDALAAHERQIAFATGAEAPR
jgi:protein subunit release factor A